VTPAQLGDAVRAAAAVALTDLGLDTAALPGVVSVERPRQPVDRILDLTGGEGVDTAIETLGADVTFQVAVKATKPGGTVSNTGYFGEGEFVRIPRVE
jgi:threonine dehydrogenase-like Zn-dependent dehydrogenase